LIAELAMIKNILEGGKCLYIVPLRALAMEKFEEFKKWEKIGVKIGISIGDYESKDEWLGEKDIIVATSEKADSLLRNKSSWLKDINCLVVDEIHLLDSVDRGAVLEILITKLRTFNSKIRILALSATIPNADELANWLNATLIKSNWRPVPLFEGIYLRGVLELYKDGMLIEKRRIPSRDPILALVADCLEKGGKVLIFESTRRFAEHTAEKISRITSEYVESNHETSKRILEENEGEISQKLAECVKFGCAFHHAGLLNSQRKIVEDNFKRGKIYAVVSTPTLAAGVNLPARRVIIKSYYRFEEYGSFPIKTLEYKQMAGRAGRPGLDQKGEAILIAKTKNEKERIFERYIIGEPERILSKLGTEPNLRFHSLSLLTENFDTLDTLESFFSKTFFFYQYESSIKWELEQVLRRLEKWHMVHFEQDKICTTELGEIVCRLYIDPLTGYIFFDTLSKKKHLSEIEILYTLCRTPNMEIIPIKSKDSWIEDEISKIKNMEIPPEYTTEYDFFLSQIKTAFCIKDWINEVDEDLICSKYGIAPGDLRRITEAGEWLSYSLFKIARYLNHPQADKLKKYEKRIKYGIKEELTELVELKGIGRNRARKLYEFGIKSKEDIIKKKDKLPMIIGKKIAENILKQVGVS
ncbi:dynein regulation protein LC7, partial [Candidatus Bathyarchaeota archaeon]